MNVYQCWYLGLNGYCCRNHNSKWIFVPALGQSDRRIHKHLSLNDLVFDNPFAKQYELKIEGQLQKVQSSPFHFLKSLILIGKKPNTVGGMLFAPI
tara:strand:- start:18785 stop:19072 length:288 start_codon:yes stop_codon:yes gene_type:complete